MEASKTAKLISNIFYSIGIGVFFILLGLILFGANITPYPDAMLPYSLRDIAFIGLAVGAVPMLFACMAVYKYNRIKMSVHKKRNFILLFIPAFLCGACLLTLIGVFVIVVIQAMLLISRQ